jgi:hypothetical protein
LERLGASLAPTSAPEVINVRIISSADGSIVNQFSVTCDDDRYNRGRRKRPWPQKANSG